jgi:hypothetical protein
MECYAAWCCLCFFDLILLCCYFGCSPLGQTRWLDVKGATRAAPYISPRKSEKMRSAVTIIAAIGLLDKRIA